MIQRVMATMAAIALLLLTGCGSPKTSDKDLVFLDPPDAQALMASGGGSLLGLGAKERRAWIDPRNQEKFDQGHIPGAIHMPLQVVRDRHQQLEEYDLLIVYSDDYRDMLAEATSKRLMQLGHKDVRTLRGGLEAWGKAGNGLEPDQD